MENAWNYIKDKLKNKNSISIPQLREVILMIWVSDIPLDYWRQLVMYMPGRIQKVIGLKGDMTKYRNIIFWQVKFILQLKKGLRNKRKISRPQAENPVP